MHREPRRAGVEAVLQVFEGQSHAQYLAASYAYLAAPYAPGAKEASRELARFFDAHLER